MKSPYTKFAFVLLAMFACLQVASAADRALPTAGKARFALVRSATTTQARVTLPSSLCNGAAGSFQNPLPANMCFQFDIAYGKDPLQKLDVYLPAILPHDAPVIVMVHGGGWSSGDKFDNPVVRNKVQKWVPGGAIFVSVNYPLVPNVDPLQQARSVAMALAYAQKHAAQWGGDPRKFILMGHSAGGHLVSLLAAEPRLATSQGAQQWLGTIALDAAVYDVPTTMGNPNHDPIFDAAFGTDPRFWDSTSPLLQLNTRAAPFMAVCSTVESGSCTRAQTFVDKALGYGADATVLQEVLDHGQINDTLGLPSDYTNQVNAFMAAVLNGSLR